MEYKMESRKNTFVIITLIIFSGFFVRFFLINFNEPLTFDALKYFLFSAEISTNSKLPVEYTQSSIFWQIILSGFFQIFQFNETLDYMNLQKILSITISSLTTIPLYLLLKKFFSKNISLIGILIFIFEPRLIINSQLGITEPLYLILGIIAFLLILSNERKIILISFISAAFAIITRGEGQMIFYAMTIWYFLKFRKNKKMFLNYLLCISFLIIIISPIMFYQYSFLGNDGIFGKAVKTIQFHSNEENNPNRESNNNFFINGTINFIKYFIWGLFPFMILLFFPGMFFFFKKLNLEKLLLLISGILLSIPAIYEYAIPLEDSRYLFMIYPILIIISLSFIKIIIEKCNHKKIVYYIIIFGIITSSLLFLNYQYESYNEKFHINEIMKNYLPENAVINQITPYSEFIKNKNIPTEWEKLKIMITNHDEKITSIRISSLNTNIVSFNESDSIDEFVNNNPNLTHLILDEKLSYNSIFSEVFTSNENFDIEKIWDSRESGFINHVKLFEIKRNN